MKTGVYNIYQSLLGKPARRESGVAVDADGLV